MRRTLCCVCGDVVDAVSSSGIRLQFCCGRCYTSYPSEVSASEARAHGCSEHDLDILNWRDPSKRRRVEKRQYIGIEAEHLGRLRKGRQQWEERHKRKATQKALTEKRRRLEHSTHVRVEDVREDLRPFVFGDYLAKPRGTRMTQKTVAERLTAHRRAAAILDNCNTEAMTALDFCVKYPMWGPVEFMDLRERMQKVFRLEGSRILHKVPSNERSKLAQTPLADVHEDFSKRNSFQYVLHYLTQRTDTNTAMQILDNPACQAALDRGGEEEDIARKLLEFWKEKNDSKKRKEKLENVLKQRQLAMPPDQLHYQSYITGSVCQDIDELIALAEFSQRLKKRGIPPWGFIFEQYHSVVLKSMNDQKMSMEEAVSSAMKRVPNHRIS